MGPGFSLHSDIVAPYLVHYGSKYLKENWLPKMAAGEAIGAIAMTEPSAGSDLQNIRTTATAGRGRVHSLWPEGIYHQRSTL